MGVRIGFTAARTVKIEINLVEKDSYLRNFIQEEIQWINYYFYLGMKKLTNAI